MCIQTRIQGRVGMRNIEAGTGPSCHRTSVSTASLLLLACHWMCCLALAGQQMAEAIIIALLLHLPSMCNIMIAVTKPMPNTTAAMCEVSVNRGVLLPSPMLQEAMPDMGGSKWPFAPVVLQDLAKALPAKYDWLLSEVMHGVARVMDVGLRQRGAIRDTDIVALAESSQFFVDPDVKLAFNALGRNPYSSSRAAKTLKAKTGAHTSRFDHECQTRYWLASRRAMTPSTTWAVSVDATRFSKKDWQCGHICNVDTQQYAWMQPVV